MIQSRKILLSVWAASFIWTYQALSQQTQDLVKKQETDQNQKSYLVILDHDYIMQMSTAALRARREIESERSQIYAQIDQQEQKLRLDEQNLIRDQSILTEDQYECARQNFEKNVAQVQQMVATKKSQLEDAFNSAREVIVAKILQIVAHISKKHHYDVVVPKSMVFYANKNLDITDDVLKELNQQLPYVQLMLRKNHD